MKLTIFLLVVALAATQAGECPFSGAKGMVSPHDVTRAQTVVPGAAYQGSDVADIATVLNGHLAADTTVQTQDCSLFSLEALNELTRIMSCGFDDKFDSIYTETNDHRQLRHKTSADWESAWAQETEHVAAAPEVEPVLRDSKCHEAVMLYIHHLSEEMKTLLGPNITLPTLPSVSHRGELDITKSGAHKSVQETYDATTQCFSCHTGSGTGTAGDFPAWPKSFTYSGRGYGKFPWWSNGYVGPSSTSNVTLIYDNEANYQEIHHSNCDLSQWSGPSKGQCVSYWKGNKGYIAVDSTNFCCEITQPPTPIVRPDFYSLMSKSDGGMHSGPFFSGQIINYTSSADVVKFWYMTKADGSNYPVGQGEDGPAGYVGVEYESFKAVEFTDIERSFRSVPTYCTNADVTKCDNTPPGPPPHA